MNYIKLINTFWEIERQVGGFTAQHQSFYFALCYFANKAEWDEFEVYREDIIDQAKIGKNTYYEVRDFFKNLGMIDFIEGASKRTKVRFKMLYVSLKRDNKRDASAPIVSLKSDNAGDNASDNAGDHTNKPLNPKTYKPSFEKEAKLGNGENFEQELDEIFSIEEAKPLDPEKKATQTGREIFENVRQLYPGIKRGAEVEWENFSKKFKDAEPDLPDVILAALQCQIAHKRALTQAKARFISPWPHFVTWINQQRWTDEMPEMETENEISGNSQVETRLKQAKNIIQKREYDQNGQRIRT